MTRRSIALLPVTLVLALVAACAPPQSDPAAANALVMRAYPLPKPYGTEVAGILQSLLSRGPNEAPAGKAYLSPTGALLVAAPAGFHPGVVQLVDGLKGAPTPPPSIRIDYWAVVGSPSTKDATKGPGLNEVAAVLDALNQERGPFSYGLLEKLSLTSLSGQRANATGAQLDVEQTATAFDDKVLATVGIRAGRNKIETRVQLPLDKTLVLAQSGVDAKNLPAKGSGAGSDVVGDNVQLYYVLRAQLVSP
jgi:hypothetical protein